MDITVKIGGEAGQGLQTVGDLISKACHRAGLYLLTVNDFESRIRGGHSFLQVRISDRPVKAPSHIVNILVALNRRTYDLHRGEVSPDGVILVNGKYKAFEENVTGIDIDKLAAEAGGLITSNTVAAGAALSLIGARFEIVENILNARFSSKGDKVARMNLNAAKLGYDSVKGLKFSAASDLKNNRPKGKIMTGARAAAMGALAADCRFAAFYPMSPATGIISDFNSFADDFPVVVEQAEDEIAAVNMIIGASYAGVRSMTATSGGGFCLMTEALGLSAMSETPVTIINAQRPGPATGLPTRTAQSDLLFAINASHDEFPRFVFAPGTAYEAFEVMIRAFHLSDKYQVPSVVLMDQYLCDSVFIAERPLKVPENIERFITEDEQIQNPSEYKRFALTSSGVSPRILPCNGKALLVATGNEHTEDGHISEDQTNRNNMMEKRLKKSLEMRKDIRSPETENAGAKIMLVSWGSTGGAVKESVQKLNETGFDAGFVNFVDIWPFPSEDASDVLGKSEHLIVVEANSCAQFGKLLKQQTGLEYDKAVLKYDGRPIYPVDILNGIKEFTAVGSK